MQGASHVRLLGGLSVAVDGERVDGGELAGGQARLVLARLLLAAGEAVPVEDVADAVWGTAPPTSWRAALRTLVSTVRARVARLGGVSVVTDGPSHRLALPSPVVVDRHVGRALLVEAEVAAEEAAHDETLRAGVAALQLLEQPFVPGAGGVWVAQQRDACREDRLRALHLVGRAHLGRGQPHRAVRTARELLAETPVRESAHRLLMESLARAGESGEAAEAYERCRAVLGDRLGVVPSKATTRLHARILRGTLDAADGSVSGGR